jgi:hypothetical protein
MLPPSYHSVTVPEYHHIFQTHTLHHNVINILTSCRANPTTTATPTASTSSTIMTPTVNFLLSIHDAKQAKDTVNHCQDHVLKTRTYLVRGRREALVVAVMIGNHSGTMGMGVME